MSDNIETLARYVPPSIAREIYSDPTKPAGSRDERLQAAVLFADVSGFTSLTEMLANKGPAGAEEITNLLNDYFGQMILLVEHEGGEVVQFSGDGLLVIFPARNETLALATRRAFQAAQKMQSLSSSNFADLKTTVGRISLAMKIGIGAGEILVLTVGGVLGQWKYVVAGQAVSQAAEVERRTPVGEVLLSPKAEAVMAGQAVTARPLVRLNWSQAVERQTVKGALEGYIPAAITHRLSAGQSDWLAELRRMSILFANVKGLEYDGDQVVDQLHQFVRTTQEIINRYEGLINKLAVDDKGTVLLALFGAPPHAHEDDPERAIRCALDLQLAAAQQKLELAIGLAVGRVFAGPVGGLSRREYTVMGDRVNLAARLMTAAMDSRQDGDEDLVTPILCDDDTFMAVGFHLMFDKPPSIQVKGKTGLVPVYSPIRDFDTQLEEESAQSIADLNETAALKGPLIGREAEMEAFDRLLAEVDHGKNWVLILEGEAGIGKSRLIQEMIRFSRRDGLPVLIGAGQSLEQHTPYRAWRDIFNAYFELEDLPPAALPEKQSQVLRCLAEFDPALVYRAPLLNDVLGLMLPETHLTRMMDADLRHQSLTALLIALLRWRCRSAPLVLVLEDVHWLDSLSWELSLAVAQSLFDQPLLMMIAMRPLDDDIKRNRLVTLDDLPNVHHMVLESLEPDEVVSLAASRLGVVVQDFPREVAGLIENRSGGNPFFAEELIYALRDTGVIRLVVSEPDQADGGAQGRIAAESWGPVPNMAETGRRCEVVGDLEALVLPETLQGVILSRIDRLQPDAQLALKVAAVIGRTFSYRTLHDVLKVHTSISENHLRSYLDELVELDLTPLEASIPELVYFFKHFITREVAYDLLLFAQRRDLHRAVARWYEDTFGDGPGLAQYYPLLVHHWRQAEEMERVRYYCRLAGQQAAEQFGNAEALEYLNQALALSENDPKAQYEFYALRERIYDLLGERDKQGDDLAELTTLGASLDDDNYRIQVYIRLAAYNEALSNYPAAITAAQSALEMARKNRDKVSEVKSLNQWGTAFGMQGDFLGAREQFKQALNALPDTDTPDLQQARATTLHNLGNNEHLLGDYPAALRSFDQALALWQDIGDSRGESRTLNNLATVYTDQGDYTNALKHLDKARSIKEQIGDLSGEAQSLHNLGAIYRDLGVYDTARTYYEQALSLERTLGNPWGEASNLTELGLIYHLTGEDRLAQDYCEQARTTAQEIGNPQVEGRATSLLASIHLTQGQLERAVELYQQALNLRLETKQLAFSVGDYAGLARCALAHDNLDEAYEYADNCATWLTVQGPVGLEDPLRVYVTCYQVFAATGRVEKARSILSFAYTTIQNRAAKIQDETLLKSFLSNSPFNKFILDAWDEYQALLSDLDDDLD
jgi:predicted ATPase/class 3 adenylate cyclase